MSELLICNQHSIATMISYLSGRDLTSEAVNKYDLVDWNKSSPPDILYVNAILDILRSYKHYSSKELTMHDISKLAKSINSFFYKRMNEEPVDVSSVFPSVIMDEVSQLYEEYQYNHTAETGLLLIYYLVNWSNFDKYDIETAFILGNVIASTECDDPITVDEKVLPKFYKSFYNHVQRSDPEKFIKKMMKFL